MIKVGAEAEPTFKGRVVEEFLKTYVARRTADRSSKRLAKMRS